MPAAYTPPVNLSSPPPIGNTTPNTIAGTTLTIGNIVLGAAAIIGSNQHVVFESFDFNFGVFGASTSWFLDHSGNWFPETTAQSLGLAGNLIGSIFTSLPTADPHVVGQLWSNLGIVTQSAG